MQTFKNLYDKLGEVAKTFNEGYYSLKIEVCSRGKVEYGVYVNGKGWYNDNTFNGALDQLKTGEVKRTEIADDIELVF